MTGSLEQETMLEGRPHDGIPRRSEADSAPPSFAQQRLWFIEQLEPGTHVYNSARAVRVRGPLDISVLRGSLNALVSRHEALRTSFRVVDGLPLQLVAPTLSLPLPIADLGGVPESEREEQAARLAEDEIRRPFDLTRAPLLRARVIRLRPQEHILVVTLHHIVSDEWSLGVLYRELAALYDAGLRGIEPTLPELPIQYPDYAAWQRGRLNGEHLAHELAYWHDRLDGAPTVLPLPTDRPRPPVQTYSGARVDRILPRELGPAVLALSRAEGATAFMTLVAAFQAVLGRYTGQDDLVVGSPIAGRIRAETEGLIGCFINMLALRTDLSGDPTFRELIRRVRETCLGAYDHQELPFERLVEELRPERSLSHSALFQVMFAMQNAPATTPSLSGLEVSPVLLERGIARFDLTLFVRQDSGGVLRASAEYNTDLFDRSTVARMLDHFQTLLQDAVADPDRRLSELRVLTDQEQHQALVAWNATEADPAGPATVHELIEAQAARTPDAVAAVFEPEELSYRELLRRADRLARHLRARGVGPDVVVGLCVERSLAMLVGLLGILKAGGAYLPLDPTHPPQRLALMLSDAGARLVVVQRERLDILPTDAIATVCLDDEERWTDPGVGPGRHSGEQLAYVIYTSGSTGKPKGVQVTHRALVNLLSSMGPYSGVQPRDVLLSVSPLIFDIATLELLLPLTVGARVAIATRETAQDGRLLAAALARAGATMMQATPTTWRMLVDSGWGDGQGLRALCGGEPLTSDLARELLARGVVLWNLYGPTETTIYSAAAPVQADSRPTLENRVANTRLYLLDRHLSPVPIGVPGELYIGGVGLARGYAGSPGLTAERFLPDPFDARTGARMYRTGDLLRRRAEGALEFLGRTDHQIKLRGFRIEPGEVEAALEAHPAVSQVAVIVREDEPGDKRLVAYLVPAPGQASAVSDLRGSLRRTLPDYMLPSAFVLLDSLPRTASGKLDRSALPPPDRQARDSSVEHVAPMGALEQVLAEICGEVLGVPEIGAHDDFFALGGHSLLATRVVSRIEAALGIELPLRHLFETPTVAGLAARIVALERSGELGP